MIAQAHEGTDYELVPDRGDDQAYRIRLLSGPYAGVSYKYDEIKISDDGDQAKISFTYVDLKAAEGVIVNQTDFQQHIGWVLHGIILRLGADASLGILDEEGNEIGTSGDDDSAESADQRQILPKGDSAPPA
jgi:hypothetical protein